MGGHTAACKPQDVGYLSKSSSRKNHFFFDLTHLLHMINCCQELLQNFILNKRNAFAEGHSKKISANPNISNDISIIFVNTSHNKQVIINE